MRKQLFTMLAMLLMAVSAVAQIRDKYENKYFSIEIPQGWTVQPLQVGGINADALVFTNEGSCIALVMGMEGEVDPMLLIESQCQNAGNMFLAGATTEPPVKSKFLGKPATAVNFSNQIFNQPYRGTVYAFNDGGCSYLALGTYQVGKPSTLPQVWRSLKWKNYVRKEDNRPLDVYMQEYCESMTELINQYGGSRVGNTVITALSYDADARCFSRTIRDESVDISDYDEETLQTLRTEVNRIAGDAILTDARTSEMVQRCVDAGVTFKMVYYDKNDKYFHTVTVTPDQYRK